MVGGQWGALQICAGFSPLPQGPAVWSHSWLCPDCYPLEEALQTHVSPVMAFPSPSPHGGASQQYLHRWSPQAWGASLQSPVPQGRRWGWTGHRPDCRCLPILPTLSWGHPRTKEARKDLLVMLYFSRSQDWNCGESLDIFGGRKMKCFGSWLWLWGITAHRRGVSINRVQW